MLNWLVTIHLITSCLIALLESVNELPAIKGEQVSLAKMLDNQYKSALEKPEGILAQ